MYTVRVASITYIATWIGTRQRSNGLSISKKFNYDVVTHHHYHPGSINERETENECLHFEDSPKINCCVKRMQRFDRKQNKARERNRYFGARERGGTLPTEKTLLMRFKLLSLMLQSLLSFQLLLSSPLSCLVLFQQPRKETKIKVKQFSSELWL